MNTVRAVVLGASAAVLTAAGVGILLLAPVSPAGAASGQYNPTESSPTVTTVSVSVPEALCITDNTPGIVFTLPVAGYGEALNNPQTVSVSYVSNSSSPVFVTVSGSDFFDATIAGAPPIPLSQLTVQGSAQPGPTSVTYAGVVTDSPTGSGTATDSYALSVPPGGSQGAYTATLQYSIGY